MIIGMQVAFKRLSPDAKLPQYAQPGDAGLDLMAIDDGEEHTFAGAVLYIEYRTGLAVEIPENFVGLIFPRSSISNKSLSLANAVGVIDSGYRGEIKFRFYPSTGWTHYKKFERIGQLVILPYPTIQPIEVDTLSDTSRGSGGYGSTGV